MTVREIIHIDHPLCSATILTQGAQLIEWTPTGHKPVLWSTDISYFKTGKAFRGGIPICWPWFGKAQLPAHGFARLMPWALLSHTEDEHGAHLLFELTDTLQTREIFPHSFRLLLQMDVGATCHLDLSIDAPIATTGALHTYFQTSDIAKSRVDGLGDRYIDALQENAVIVAATNDLTIDRSTDRIYTNAPAITALITVDQTLHISHQSHSDVVIWNPWIEASVAIADMNSNDYCHMICIETARISTPLSQRSTLGVSIDILESKFI